MTTVPEGERDSRADRSVDAMRERFVELCTSPLPEPAAVRLRSFLQARSPSERAVLAPGSGLRAAARAAAARTSAARAAVKVWQRSAPTEADAVPPRPRQTGGTGEAAAGVAASKIPPPAPSWEDFRRRRAAADGASPGEDSTGDATVSE